MHRGRAASFSANSSIVHELIGVWRVLRIDRPMGIDAFARTARLRFAPFSLARHVRALPHVVGKLFRRQRRLGSARLAAMMAGVRFSGGPRALASAALINLADLAGWRAGRA